MPDADLKELRQSFEDDDAQWVKIREARATDIKALTPDSTWDDKDREARKAAGRPCLSFDELGQYVNQLVNDARETKRAIEVNPAGDSATEDVARFVADLIRQIEYRSNAQMAYTQMFDDTVSGSYGYVRIVPEWIQQKVGEPTARSFDQELLIKPVPNPDTITPGYFTNPDMSDAIRFWVHESYEPDAYKDAFPDAEVKTFDKEQAASVGVRWYDGKRIWVRELWEKRTKPRKLVLMRTPQGELLAFWKDTIPEGQGYEMVRERWVDQPYVCQKVTNGLELLKDKTDWPGAHIPIVGCVGRVLFTKEERQILSLIRNALGPQQLYNYYRTSEAEIVGMTPKIPWFYYEGALDAKQLAALKTAHQVPVGAIGIKAAPEGWPAANGPIPFPQRQVYEPPIQALEMGAESTRRGIQSATGTGFLPTEAQRVNQKSGVALREIATSAMKGAYHMVDNYQHAIRRVGVVLVDLIPHYYDAQRAVHVRGADDKTQQVTINAPGQAAPKPYGGKPIILSKDQEFDVTISTGPSYATERDKASEFADQLVQARPEVFGLIGGDVVRLKNLGPIGDKIAEILDAMAPPAVQQLRAGQQPMPPQVQQVMMQLQQAQQMIKQLQQVIETDQIKEGAKTERETALAQIDAQLRMALEQLKGNQQIERLRVQVAADIEKREDEQAHDVAMAGAEASKTARQAVATAATRAPLGGERPGV